MVFFLKKEKYVKQDLEKLIVITGACGFIGSCVVRHLNDLGYTNLLLVDDCKEGDKWKNLVGKKFIDLISKHVVFQELEEKRNEIDSIIHLGACSDTCETNADYLIENNYRFTKKLCQFALANEIRFVYASSAATYGDGKLGFSDDEDFLEKLKPLNMYAFSKHLFDLWAKREKLLDKIVGLKYFNVFGPNENHKKHMSSMIYKMAHVVNNDGLIKLFKSNDLNNFDHGEQKRDFIYVKDAVKMTTLFLNEKYRNVNGIFNVGSARASSWNEMAKYLFGSLKKEIKIEYIDMPLSLTNQYQNYTCANMEKFKNISDYQLLSMQEAVSDYVPYLIGNERW